MNEEEIAYAFINLMAEAVSLLKVASEQQVNVLGAYTEDDEIYETVKTALEATKEKEVTELLEVICTLLQEAKKQFLEKRYSYGKAICKCMDLMITYSNSAEGIWSKGRISLYSLFHPESNVLITSELNQNKCDTGICLTPKFPVGTMASDLRIRSLSSRDSLFGINGELNNISYYLWNEKAPEVHHVFLQRREISEKDGVAVEETKIAYTPLTDKNDVLILSGEYEKIIRGIPCRVRGLEGVRHSEYIERRFEKSLEAVGSEGVDIFFAPEMLATEKMAEIENEGSVFLKPLFKRVILAGNRPPRLTLLPSYWKNGVNSVFIFDETGRLCGKQNKGTPYVNKKAKWVEAIDVEKAPDVVLIHMINQQRVAVVICAEFLANKEYVSEFLCRQLGATLILVPAYSSGEQDFVNMLPVLKPYGTSVIWGNCCGAVSTGKENGKRIIGGCSLAGIDEIHRMGTECKCNFMCGDRENCVFLIKIPAVITSEKPKPPSSPEIIHL